MEEAREIAQGNGEQSDLAEEIEVEMEKAGSRSRQVTFEGIDIRAFNQSEEELQGKREECKRIAEARKERWRLRSATVENCTGIGKASGI